MNKKYLFCPSCGMLARTGYYSNIIGCHRCGFVLRIEVEHKIEQQLKEPPEEPPCK